MKPNHRFAGKATVLAVFTCLMSFFCLPPAYAGSAAEIDRKVASGLETLYAGSPTAKDLSTVAKAVLVFPDIIKAGAQSFGYALFLMTDDAMNYLKNSDGWEIGVGPSVVVVDAGVARSLTTSTAKEDIYAFFFDQKGLMAGLGLQGSKITRITPDK